MTRRTARLQCGEVGGYGDPRAQFVRPVVIDQGNMSHPARRNHWNSHLDRHRLATPEHAALRFMGATTTWRQLHDRVCGLADAMARRGIDMIVQAEAGCLSGQPTDRPPRLIPFQVIDGATGHVVAQAVLAALLHRERFGVVNEVRVSMYDVACSLQSNYLTLQMNTPAPEPTTAPEARRPVAVHPSGIYPTRDGELVLAAYVPEHWKRLITLVGRPERAAGPRSADQAARSSHAAELR